MWPLGVRSFLDKFLINQERKRLIWPGKERGDSSKMLNVLVNDKNSNTGNKPRERSDGSGTRLWF